MGWSSKMKTTEHESEDFRALMKSLVELHEWELAHMPMMQTMTGRSLYYRMVQAVLNPQQDGEKALKEMFSSNHFTARAMRTRMQSMRQEGWLELQSGHEDARMKHLTPTANFTDLALAHAQQLRKLLGRFFIVINK